jgi:hypothetical protein
LVYIVKWVGYSHKDNTQEVKDLLAHSDEYLVDFLQTHPKKPGSPNAVVAKKATEKQAQKISTPKPAETST